LKVEISKILEYNRDECQVSNLFFGSSYLKVTRSILFACAKWIQVLIAFLVSLESSQRGGVHGLGFMEFELAVQKFLNIE
jgi:hypothetical protein